MKSFIHALMDSFEQKDGYFSYEFGDGYELTFEPLLFDNQYHVALYHDKELLIEKVVVKPGK